MFFYINLKINDYVFNINLKRGDYIFEHNMIKKIKRFNKNIFIFFIITICLITQAKFARAEEDNVIKVGYPTVKGFTELKNGIYSGYAYEYLSEIAKYTGWEYEFVEMSLMDSLNALKNGEIDIVAGMYKNDASMKIYDFPDYDMGSTYATLSTLRDNKNISKSDYKTLDGIKVGYYERSKVTLEKFTEFCKKHDINNVELIPYSSEEVVSLTEKLKSKEIDAILTGDLLIESEEKVVAKFGTKEYYFATTKGNKKVIEELNRAIYNIEENNYYFEQQLYNKYFQSNNDYSLILSNEEDEYIKNVKELKAVYIENFKPLQYYDNDTKKVEGIFVDFVNLIFENLDIKLDLIKVKTYEEAYKMIQEKKADLIVGVPGEYSSADKNGIKLTASYLNLEMVSVVRKDHKNQANSKKVALAQGHGYVEPDSNYEFYTYDTVEECIEAVNKGEVDLIYGNKETISHYTAIGYYPDLRVISEMETVGVSVGLPKQTNKNFLSAINKSINSISKDESQNIIYENTMRISHKITLKQFFFENLTLCIGIIAIVLGIISIMIFIIVKMKFNRINESKEILFRKTQIDSLTSIYNRSACERLITEYLTTKEPSLYGSFIIIDIDNFKGVNDYLGHKIGDKVLIEFAGLLKEFFSHQDIISRLGGDEFIVFMKDIHEDNLQKVNEKLQELCMLMNKEVKYNNSSQIISLSVGAITIKENLNFEELYQMADEMLYEVKHNGKNGFKVKKYNC